MIWARPAAFRERQYVSGTGRDRIVVVLTGDTDWEEIRELVTESYRIPAPNKLTALLD